MDSANRYVYSGSRTECMFLIWVFLGVDNDKGSGKNIVGGYEVMFVGLVMSVAIELLSDYSVCFRSK